MAERNLEVLPLIICFIWFPCFLRKKAKKNIHVAVLIYEKVNEYYLFLNQGLSNSVVRRLKTDHKVKSKKFIEKIVIEIIDYYENYWYLYLKFISLV